MIKSSPFRFLIVAIIPFLFSACNSKKGGEGNSGVPTVAFLDAFEDNTLGVARKGFWDALKDSGFSEEQKTINVLYRNAQGDIPKLTLALKYFNDQKPDLIATCPTLSTITALQNNTTIPVFMMVSPVPSLMQLSDEKGKEPANLFGVGDNIDYIDTSFGLIPQLIKPKGAKLKVGVLYNQSEPQSVEAIERLKQLATRYNAELEVVSVSNSADLVLSVKSLIAKNIDAFFANPDNVVFSGFENILESCHSAGVPVFSSEAGLVSRGAVAAYGADIYQWGYQSGAMAATYLKKKSTTGLKWTTVAKKQKVYNGAAAEQFHLTLPADYIKIQ